MQHGAGGGLGPFRRRGSHQSADTERSPTANLSPASNACSALLKIRFIYEGWRLAEAVTNSSTGDQLANDLTTVEREVCDFPHVLRVSAASLHRWSEEEQLAQYVRYKYIFTSA